jgi:NAD(P)H dehydrogenase (quinone)
MGTGDQMKALIVYAHPEAQSFSSTLARTAAEALSAGGHEVRVIDLYARRFDPVSDRRNFTITKNPAYFKQQVEEAHASEHAGFSEELLTEMENLEWCEALIFCFPLWWFGMPAILKGWVDRVFTYGRIYNSSKIYEAGLGKGQRRGLVLMTTGGGEKTYSGRGVNPPLGAILAPIQHGIFWFNGFQPLEPFVAWSVAHISDEDRHQILTRLRTRIARIFEESPLELPPLADFPGYNVFDLKKRFAVTITRRLEPDGAYHNLVGAERERVAELRRLGFVTSAAFSADDEPEWRAFFEVRAASREEAQQELLALPLARYLDFQITEIR